MLNNVINGVGREGAPCPLPCDARTCRPGRSGRPLRASRSGRSGWSVCSGRSRCACRSSWASRTSRAISARSACCSSRSGRTFGSGSPRWPSRTRRPSCSVGPSGTSRASRPVGSGRSSRANRPRGASRPNLASGAILTISERSTEATHLALDLQQLRLQLAKPDLQLVPADAARILRAHRVSPPALWKNRTGNFMTSP